MVSTVGIPERDWSADAAASVDAMDPDSLADDDSLGAAGAAVAAAAVAVVVVVAAVGRLSFVEVAPLVLLPPKTVLLGD